MLHAMQNLLKFIIVERKFRNSEEYTIRKRQITDHKLLVL